MGVQTSILISVFPLLICVLHPHKVSYTGTNSANRTPLTPTRYKTAKIHLFSSFTSLSIGGSKGWGARDARPLGGQNSFIFMQFRQKVKKIIPLWELAPPLRKILDPPLLRYIYTHEWTSVKAQPGYHAHLLMPRRGGSAQVHAGIHPPSCGQNDRQV